MRTFLPLYRHDRLPALWVFFSIRRQLKVQHFNMFVIEKSCVVFPYHIGLAGSYTQIAKIPRILVLHSSVRRGRRTEWPRKNVVAGDSREKKAHRGTREYASCHRTCCGTSCETRQEFIATSTPKFNQKTWCQTDNEQHYGCHQCTQ